MGNVPKLGTGPQASSEEIATTKPQKVVRVASTLAHTRPYVDEWSRAHTADVLQEGIKNKKRIVEDIEHKYQKDNTYVCAMIASVVFFVSVLIVNLRQ